LLNYRAPKLGANKQCFLDKECASLAKDVAGAQRNNAYP